jgi:magnesium transporter
MCPDQFPLSPEEAQIPDGQQALPQFDEVAPPVLPSAENEDEDENFYGLSDEMYSGIIAAVRADDWLTVEHEVLDLEPSDIAQLLEKARGDDALEMVKHLHGILDSETWTYLGYDRLKKFFAVLSPREIAAIIADLNTDDAISLLEDIDTDERREILRHVNERSRALVEEGLTFPEDSAGRLMQRDVVAIPQFWTVGKALDYLQALGDELPKQLYDLFLVNPRHQVVGQVAIGQLLRVKRGVKISEISDDDPAIIPADTDQEEVAALFKRTTVTSVPVIDNNERLIGVITVDDVVSVIDEEASEDILRLAGVENDDLAQPAIATAWSRFRWLFVNLLTALLASSVVGQFEAVLEKIVALAVLMPIVAGMGGNAGTQTLTVAVRALATKELSAANYWRVTFKETMVGVMNGAAFAVIMGVVAWLWFKDLRLGMVIGAAMITNLFFAGLTGMLIPIGLHKMKSDPAISATVFLTTVTDIVGFASFLGLATIFLLHR